MEGEGVTEENHWPLHKRVEELLQTLVTSHRKVTRRPIPEFHAYKGKNEQCDWLEHPGIPRYRNRVPVLIEDIGVLWARKMVRMVGNRPDDKTFDLTPAGFDFYDEHCKDKGATAAAPADRSVRGTKGP